jgi:CRISPR-associated exonuclease Cas4
MANWLLLAAVVLAGLGLWVYLRAGSARRAAGLPAGRVTYVDTGDWDRCERPLFSAEHRLTGRPDYLASTRKGTVPVEVKSGSAGSVPYPAHVMQLVAYCLLVEEQEGRAPPHGILSYADRAFEVDYTPALRAELLQTLRVMRRDLRACDVGCSHDEPRRCLGCGYRADCGQSLA